jgi:S-adenosylmethionine synthetase
MAGRIGTELGIPTLQANATMLRNTLTNLPSTYSKATTGYDVNANQLARIIGQKSSELSPMVQTAETSLSGAQNTLGQRMGYEQTDQAKALLPYQTEQTLLSDRLARETTLYSQDNQNELNALISKMQMGVTLSEGEKNRANQLAIQEQDYNNAKETTAAGTQIVEVGGRKKLINSQTGAVIQDLGPSTVSGGGTDATSSAINSMMSQTGGDKGKMWQWIHQWEPELGKQGVQISRLWDLYNR